MSDDVLARLVGQMSVAEFCTRVGCEIEELVECVTSTRAAPPEPPQTPTTAPRDSKDADLGKGLMSLPLKEARAEFERRYLQRMVEACGGNTAEASRRSGMCRSATYVILNRPRGTGRS